MTTCSREAAAATAAAAAVALRAAEAATVTAAATARVAAGMVMAGGPERPRGRTGAATEREASRAALAVAARAAVRWEAAALAVGERDRVATAATAAQGGQGGQ